VAQTRCGGCAGSARQPHSSRRKIRQSHQPTRKKSQNAANRNGPFFRAASTWHSPRLGAALEPGRQQRFRNLTQQNSPKCRRETEPSQSRAFGLTPSSKSAYCKLGRRRTASFQNRLGRLADQTSADAWAKAGANWTEPSRRMPSRIPFGGPGQLETHTENEAPKSAPQAPFCPHRWALFFVRTVDSGMVYIAALAKPRECRQVTSIRVELGATIFRGRW